MTSGTPGLGKAEDRWVLECPLCFTSDILLIFRYIWLRLTLHCIFFWRGYHPVFCWVFPFLWLRLLDTKNGDSWGEFSIHDSTQFHATFCKFLSHIPPMFSLTCRFLFKVLLFCSRFSGLLHKMLPSSSPYLGDPRFDVLHSNISVIFDVMPVSFILSKILLMTL